MISLPNGCSCSQLSVFPKNGNTKKAPLNIDWYIHYRFYDPTFKEHTRIKGKKHIVLKGGTKYRLLEERQDAIRNLLANEKDLLINKAYNPITGQISEPHENLLGGRINDITVDVDIHLIIGSI
jgi:hypothetical protein